MRTVLLIAALAAGFASSCAPQGGPDSEQRLTGGEWVVEDLAQRGVVDSSHTTLAFGDDMRVSGQAGCNRYTADFTVEGDEIRFGPAAMTRKMCVPALMDQEARFTRALAEARRFSIDDSGALALLSDSGARLALARRR